MFADLSLLQIIATVLALLGTMLIAIAAIGILRMPDLFLRMSVSTKAATLGLGLVLIGTALYFSDLGVSTRAIATVIFVLLTAPVSAHMIGRAAYSDGVPLWEKTRIDELQGQYPRARNGRGGPHRSPGAEEAESRS
jgi:multicomponent Na+:H+ antiporter subunit G